MPDPYRTPAPLALAWRLSCVLLASYLRPLSWWPRQVQAVTDNKIWDDGAGSAGEMRSVVAAQSKARREQEAKELAARNAEHKKSLEAVHSAVDDGDGHQF